MRQPWRLKDEQGHLLRYPYRFFEEKESFSCVIMRFFCMPKGTKTLGNSKALA